MQRHLSSIGSRRTRTAGLVAAAVLLVSACGEEAPAPGAASPPVPPESFGHVHGLAVDPGTDELLLAGHHGLFDLGGADPEKIGVTNDLMGFAVAGPGHYYASGHPGEGSGMPNPMGLIESTDGGETWEALSRQGESDFHAMAVSSEGIVGFDGTLRLSAEGRQWAEAEEQLQPVHLAAFPEAPVVLATTQQGVQRSTDGGDTWQPADGAPVLLVTGFAGPDTAVGVDPEGAVHVSRDAGLTWERTGGQVGQPAAVAADVVGDELHVWVATEHGVEFSDDGGTSFSTTVPTAGH